jgi:effector-binding domain-containing protein
MTDSPYSRRTGSAPSRTPLEPEVGHLSMRETAVITVDVPAEELPRAIGEAIAEVESAMREAGVDLAGPPFARYLEFAPRIRAEIGFPVLRPAPDFGRVRPGRLPGGRIAWVLHVGPYDGLHETYARLMRWLAGQGLHPSGPAWEVYWSDPETEPDPATRRTELFAPVE